MATQSPSRPTTLVPITELVEVPVLSKAEKAELIGSLEEAEAEIARGEGAIFKSGELLTEYRKHRARRQAV